MVNNSYLNTFRYSQNMHYSLLFSFKFYFRYVVLLPWDISILEIAEFIWSNN